MVYLFMKWSSLLMSTNNIFTNTMAKKIKKAAPKKRKAVKSKAKKARRK